MLETWGDSEAGLTAGVIPPAVEELVPGGVPRARSGLRILLVGLDLAGALVAWLSILELTDRHANADTLLITSVVLTVGMSIVSATQGLYRSRVCAIRSAEVAGLAKSAIVVMLGLAWWSGTSGSRLPITSDVVGGVSSLAVVALLRSGYSTWLRNRRRQGLFTRPICMLGTNEEAEQIVRLLREQPEIGYTVVAAVGDPDEWAVRGTGVPALRAGRDFAKSVQRTGASGVVVAATIFSPDELELAVRRLASRGLHVQISTGLGRVGCRRVRTYPLSNRLLFCVEGSQPPLWHPAVKRVIDVVVASLALVASAPLLIAAAAAIKMEDDGPIFFRQERVGRDRELFRLIKLRTMVPGATDQLHGLAELNQRDGPLFKLSLDPRVTRVGRLLRATSIDELPQLVNVLKGEMSLVGPRPALPSEMEHFDADLRERTSVAPGITGLWQVEARDNPSFDAYRRLDLFYIDNRSLVLDIEILVATVGVVLGRTLTSLRSGREVRAPAERAPIESAADLINHLSPVSVSDPGVVSN